MIILIAAVGKNNELGKDDKLLWNLPNDLKFFKEITLNKTVVMGYNTYLSLPRLLPKRKNVVLYEKDLKDVITYHSKEELLNSLKEDLYIIGGANVYKQFIDDASVIYLTEIDDSKDADVYFPKFNKNNFQKIFLKENSDGKVKYKHYKYVRYKDER